MLTISIVLYKNDLSQLNRLFACINNPSVNQIIYVIDNHPGNVNLLYNKNIHYIANKINVGFGAAHNIAIKKAIEIGSTYHLLLNPDISFKYEIIGQLIQYMDNNKDVGLIMPQILYPTGEIQFLPKLLPSPLQLFVRKLPVPKTISARFNKIYEMRDVPSDLIFEAPIISGCFALFRTDVFKKIGLFDERFFMYFEDFDISRRASKYYKTIYYPLVFIYHEYNRGAQKNLRLFWTFISSAIKYFNKWGWFFDEERKIINKNTIQKIKTKLK